MASCGWGIEYRQFALFIAFFLTLEISLASTTGYDGDGMAVFYNRSG